MTPSGSPNNDFRFPVGQGPRERLLQMTDKFGRKKLLICVGAAVLVIFILALVLAMNGGDPEKSTEKNTGCTNDEQCGHNKICAAGGCLLMISSEIPQVWHEDIEQQKLGTWKLRESYGEKLLPAHKCPAKIKKTNAQGKEKTSTVSDTTVYEVQKDKLKTYRQVRAKGQLWIDAIRIKLMGGGQPSSEKICTSQGVAHLSMVAGHYFGNKATNIDVALKTAAPAGTVAEAAIMVVQDIKNKDDQKTKTFSLTLVPAVGAQKHTVVVFALGFDVIAIEGPPPTGQRLLEGHVAYYWDHGKTTSEVTITYAPRTTPSILLDISTIRP